MLKIGINKLLAALSYLHSASMAAVFNTIFALILSGIKEKKNLKV